MPDITGATELIGSEYVLVLLLAALAALVPALFVAVTVNVYSVFIVNPETVIVPLPPA
jgi:hypothetical protein